MKHSGKARRAAFKLILLSLIAGCVIWAILFFASIIGAFLTTISIPILIIVWVVFALFTLYFFRDPNPRVPPGANLILSPGHGKVDVIDTTSEAQFMGGECRRVSIFLSVLDVHVQNAPVSGNVTFYKYATGQFLNALKTESAQHNENLLLGFEASEPRGLKIGVRLIAGAIARRIVPFVQLGDEVARGERISLIQFGSRADVYLPLSAKVKVQLGDHVAGGHTVLATLE
jgi:phosphatidylserine decarboxylase